jgi:hypothetical protein
MADRDLLERIDEHMARGNEHMARHAELLEKLREENRREHELNRAAIRELREVTREVLLELREHRPILERIEQGIHAQTQGLLHVLDELRGRGGSEPAAG